MNVYCKHGAMTKAPAFILLLDISASKGTTIEFSTGAWAPPMDGTGDSEVRLSPVQTMKFKPNGEPGLRPSGGCLSPLLKETGTNSNCLNSVAAATIGMKWAPQFMSFMGRATSLSGKSPHRPS